MKMTYEEYQQYEDEFMGYCRTCDDMTTCSVEADAERYPCDECGKKTVYGVMNALIYSFINIIF